MKLRNFCTRRQVLGEQQSPINNVYSHRAAHTAPRARSEQNLCMSSVLNSTHNCIKKQKEQPRVGGKQVPTRKAEIMRYLVPREGQSCIYRGHSSSGQLGLNPEEPLLKYPVLLALAKVNYRTIYIITPNFRK